MHPMLLIESPADGLIYINGSLAGEVRTDAPLFRPVSPWGQMYLEYRPFETMRLPCACRLVFSNGEIVPASVPSDGSVHITAWPYSVTQARLCPRRIYTESPKVKTLSGSGRTFKYIKEAGAAYIEVEYRGRMHLHPLPPGACEPVLAEGDGVLYISGDTEENSRYALCLTQTGETLILSLSGSAIRFLPAGRIEVTERLGDTAGHISKTVYARTDTGCEIAEKQILPNPDCDFRPVTPLESALCAMDALILGLDGEARAFFAPGYAPDNETIRFISGCDAASPLLFTPPTGETAAAVLKNTHPCLTQARAVFFRAELISGEWKILSLKHGKQAQNVVY